MGDFVTLMAAVETSAYRGPRPVCQEKPDCRYHNSTQLTQPVLEAPEGDRFQQAPANCNYDNEVRRSMGRGLNNPNPETPPSPGGSTPGYRKPMVNPALLPAAGCRVQHNNVVRPGILDKEHSAHLDTTSRTWVNHPDFLHSPPPLDPDGAPQVREQDQGFDTWGWALNSDSMKVPPPPTRGHEGYGPAAAEAEVKWRSSVSMANVRMNREQHGRVHHVPSALEKQPEQAPAHDAVVPP